MATKPKLKSWREWLTPLEDSDSYIKVSVDKPERMFNSTGGDLTIKFSDCGRKIEWYFGRPGDKKAMAKIAKVKAAIDKVYNYLHEKEATGGS